MRDQQNLREADGEMLGLAGQHRRFEFLAD